jgi:hypothetical protein
MTNFQVTLLSGKATPLIAAGQPNVYASFLIIQNNAGANVTFGGSTVTASIGIVVASGAPGGSSTMQFNFPRGCLLNNVYLFGTAGNLIQVCYEPSV